MNDSSKLDRIADHIDRIREDIREIKVDLAVHILRTKLAEENIKLLREELEPVETHVERVNGGLKLLAGLAIVGSILKIYFEFFLKF